MSGEIGKLAEELGQTGDAERRRDIAIRLRDLGFARRTNLAKRGTVSQPAASQLTARQLEAIHTALFDEDRSVRLTAILIVGDLGDATSVSSLRRLCDDQDPEIRLAAIDSLGDIGGPESISVLASLAREANDEEEIRLAALTELEELVAKEITSGPDRRFDPRDRPARATPDAHEADDVTQAKAVLIQALDSIESDPDADDLLRLKAADVGAYLASGVA